jgi:cytochrome b561
MTAPPASAPASIPASTSIPARYGRPAIALHWLSALLIIAMLFLGFWMVDLPRRTPARGFYFNLHKSFGIVVGVLVLARVTWRLTHAAPVLPACMPRWQAAAARTNHFLLYACMALQPLTGYVGSSFNQYGVKVFGFALPQWAWEDRHLRELFAAFHGWLAIVLSVLVGIHVAAACKHLLKHDGIFQRMLPTRP